MESDKDSNMESDRDSQDNPQHQQEQKEVNEEQEPPPLQTKMEYIHEQANKGLPLVGYFPSGFDPQSQETNKEPPKVRIFRNKLSKRDKRLQLVVTPSGSSLDFVGTSYLGEAETRQACKYALGVLDKDSGKLTIVPIAANKIFRLEPKVRNSDLADEEPQSKNEELSPEKNASRKRELNNLYGTKKSIKAAKKLYDLNKEDDPYTQKVLDSQIKNVPGNEEALESTIADIARNIPPYDSSATTPQEAYPLNKIIIHGEWNFLEDIYYLLQAGEEVSTNAYPTFVCNRIHKLQQIQVEAEQRMLASILSYITHLIKFKDQHSMEGASSAKSHRIPSILHQKFMSRFGNPDSKRLSVDKINLLMGYVLVLTLHADEFQTTPDDIAKDLRISVVQLRSHFENLGCKLRRENNRFVATLPVPLKFPDSNSRRRRR